MPISAEQWRALTGSLNAGKGALRPRASFKPSSPLFPLLPSNDWKDYSTAMVLVCTPLLLYRLYLVCVVIMMYLVNRPGANILNSSPYTSAGLTADVSISFMNHHDRVPWHLLFTMLNVLLYLAMVMVAVFFGIKEYILRTRKKHDWVLTQQLDHLDLYLLNFGPDCEVFFDPETCNAYATLSMKDMHTEPVLKCERVTSDSKTLKREKNSDVGTIGHMLGVMSFFLQLSTLVVLAMLLLLAGDVERNPGPIHVLDLATLTKELSPAKDKWHEIGIQLQISPAQLSAIEDMYPTVDRRLSEMLVYWLDGNTKSPICWESILEGLKAATVNKKGLAEKLKEQLLHCQANELKKMKSGLPFLDLSGYNSPMEAEAHKLSLLVDFHKMKVKFQDLLITTTKSLEERNIAVEDIHLYVSQICDGELNEAKKITEAMTIISKNSSFFNYLLVKQIIKHLGSPEDKTRLEEYEIEFQKYGERTIYECPPELGGVNLEGLPSVLVKLHHQRYMDCPVNQLVDFMGKFAKTLGPPGWTFLLESAKPGCLELIIRVPLPVHQNTFPLSPQQEQELAALGVIKISAGDYQYPSSQDEDHDDSDHKDDKPDDGQDDAGASSESGFSTGLSNVLSERSEQKQNMAEDNPYKIDFEPTKPPDQRQSEKKETSTGTTITTPLHTAAFHGILDSVKILNDKPAAFNPMQKDQHGNTALHCAVRGHHLDVLKYFIETEHCNPTVFSLNGETPLHLAARLGHLDIVKYLIADQGVDPMCEDEDNITPLHAACIGGKLAIVLYIVKQYQEYQPDEQIVSDKTKQGLTPLHYAAFYGHAEIVKFFITDLKCDPNIPLGCNGQTPLHLAAQEGYVDIMRYLIDNTKCNPSQEDNYKKAPLHIAAFFGQLEAVKLLLNKGCDPFCRDARGNTPLHDAALFGRLHVVKYYIGELKCDPNIPGHEGLTPIHCAAQEGHVDIMKFFIDSAKCNPSTLVHTAARNGEMEAIKFLTLDQGCDPSCTDTDGNSPIHYAALNGHVNVVEFLITVLKCNPNTPGENGWTPLHFACEGGHTCTSNYLIDKAKCYPSQLTLNNNKTTPLHIAAEFGNLDVVKLLTLGKGCDTFCRDIEGLTPLDRAALGGQLNVVKFFITELKCDPNIPGENGPMPLHCAAQKGHVDVMKYLIDNAKCNPSQKNNKKVTPLHVASGNGRLETVKLLLDKGCDPSCRDIGVNTPLHYASLKGHLNVIKTLITEWKCDPNIPGNDGLTPLHFAAQNGHMDIVQYLIDTAKCNPSQLDNNTGTITPLHYAAGHGQLDIVKFLLNKGCDPFCVDTLNNTPLHNAAFLGQLNVVKFFITELKCDPNIPGNDGVTPLQCAAQEGHVNVMKYLIDNAKCNPSQENNDKVTPLHTAGAGGQLEVVKLLTIENGCDPSCKDTNGRTPLHYAAKGAHLNVVKFFVAEMKIKSNIPDYGGTTPLHLAAQGGNLDTMKYLIDSAKCNPSRVTNNENLTPLHVAAISGQLQAVRFLTLEKSCDPMCKDKLGATPLHCAAEFGHLNIVKYFVEHLHCPVSVETEYGATPLEFASIKGHQDTVLYLLNVLIVESGIHFYNTYVASSSETPK